MTLTTRTPSALAAALRDIQAPVRPDLEAVGQELWRIVSADVPLVQNVQEHLMGMKGKLFRPTLLLLSSSVEGESPRRAVTFAAIIELIHLATLVHDDAVDHSVLRRGMPTLNALFSHQVSVIMGDYLYLRALRELVTIGDLEAMRAITFASNEMTLGEIRQLAQYDALSFSERDYETLIRAKTAALFMAACDVGAQCGAPQHREALSRFGERLGMAFQVADDLLDYTEQQEMTGKPSGLDLKEHKVTLPLIAALREMPASARARVDALFASAEPEEEAIAEVVTIVREHGGLEYARRRADQYSREAEEALADLPEGPSKSSLLDAIGYVVERRW
ncbi:polyprenyl synthetase family protein [Gemmatimonas sp.]|jgi:octaprenyl-diphosphate synthase|uniref:polyprenyl synthetase family protein n=1 Tax=Gemmatimonas sp. TaxID=1962908 RepID=UPI0022C43F29|nr:polyprenyl synthetase family protein [Gemmatimonas sp.]MCA2985221.1 polyprenyl synthetase family protein [Gemmatimonas sp.]MCA2986874.1 polyprenyl synthetase family protein [Gemmatimonas sp.]MCA2991239.1 polyprenyl synthetase family protein [Gemmatimonas sp.]MCA2994015.1 polyprenyl synthetase family protein [Gemmatimonas sp.]MCE2953924.1 polyprenyl synthetase family protein [Gemmatimonas sp.]